LRYTLRKRIIKSSIFLALIPFVATSIYIYISVYYNVLNNYNNRVNQMLDIVSESVNVELQLYVQRSRTILSSSNVISGVWGYFEADSNKIVDFRDIMRSLTIDLANWGTDIDTYKFYFSDYSGFEDIYVASIEQIPDKTFVQKVLAAPLSEEFWGPQVKTDQRTGKAYLTFYRNVTDIVGHEGLLEVNIPYEKIGLNLRGIKPLSPDSIITHRNSAGAVLLQAKGEQLVTGASVESVNSKRFFIYQTQLMDKSVVSIAIPKTVVTREYARIFYYVLVAFVLFIAFIIISSVRTSNRITRSLNGFINYLKFNDELLFNSELPKIEANDEISIIKHRFLLVISKLNTTYTELLAAKNQNNRLEIELLQARFNPHLLYNTLSVIKWSALRTDDGRTAELIDALSHYYRIVLSKGDTIIAVSDELTMIKEYISIVNYTHRNEYLLTIQVEEELLHCHILKHILQPVIENSILHGLKGKGASGCVTINGRLAGEDLIFEVIDNGYGMSPEQVEQILDPGYEAAYGGYGIKNLSRRIAFYYGGSYGIAIESEIGAGTKVTIRLKAAAAGGV